MKIKIMLSILVLSMFSLSFIAIDRMNDNLIESRRLAFENCQVTPYTCFPPPVGFASLH
ncbi:hypothetical protein D3C76_1163300 [compost metagenome]